MNDVRDNHLGSAQKLRLARIEYYYIIPLGCLSTEAGILAGIRSTACLPILNRQQWP